MSIQSMFAVPAAFILVLASTASAAQDKPTSTTVSKPVTTLSKSAKHASKPAPLHDATVKTVKQEAETQSTPSTTPSTPVSERSYEGCHHGNDGDA